jgi:outer membrane protein assembly factor BamE
MRPIYPIALVCLFMTACSTIYKQPVFQGNLLDKTSVDQVSAGMTRQQVFSLLGSPALEDPFHQNRWDYVATQRRGHGQTNIKIYTVYFQDDAVTRMEGEYFAEQDAQLAAEMAKFGNIPKDKDKKKRR